MTPNIFSAIAENDDDFKITPREKFLKKAAKKLNEIERLKEKGKYISLTAEECAKLLKEGFWQSCLYEEPEHLKPNIKEERKQKKEAEKIKKQTEAKEAERRAFEEYQQRKKEEEQKRKEEEQKRKEEEKKQKEEEQKQKEEEQKRKEEEQKQKEEERKRKKQEKKTNKKINRDSIGLEDEYKNLLLLQHGNNNKTFRILSLKYHPDKNVGRQTWASEMQKQLGEFREKYQYQYPSWE